MASIRRWHLYLSVLVAPSLLMFTLTGAVQTFRIPDQPGSPVWLQQLARVHKDDVFAANPPRRRPPGPEMGRGEGGPRAEAPRPPRKQASVATKSVFAILSLVMAVTTAFGLWLAVAFHAQRRLMWALLAAGVVIPVVTLML